MWQRRGEYPCSWSGNQACWCLCGLISFTFICSVSKEVQGLYTAELHKVRVFFSCKEVSQPRMSPCQEIFSSPEYFEDDASRLKEHFDFLRRGQLREGISQPETACLYFRDNTVTKINHVKVQLSSQPLPILCL